MPSPLTYIDYFRSIGWKWVFHRIKYNAIKKSGILFKQNPLSTGKSFSIPIEIWKENAGRFIFTRPALDKLHRDRRDKLRQQAEKILSGSIPYFNGNWMEPSASGNWLADPVDGFIYNNQQHFTLFNEFGEGRDIKFVWERSRFSYLLTIMRYDHHFNEDHSAFVFNEILTWIDQNPFNCGPNYISSQEIAIRILNWSFLLYYYSDSLQDQAYKKIMQSVYDQLVHIDVNLGFAKQLVRNNHIITEAAALFIFSLLLAELPEAKEWQFRSKKILEEEIDFQIFKDGTYLQYSMNYHRVVIQVLTFVLKIASVQNITFSDTFHRKAERSLRYLYVCANPDTGRVPNYGSNDGSLFFPLNDHDYSDYRPSLQALGNLLGIQLYKDIFEDTLWFMAPASMINRAALPAVPGVFTFPESGYYIINENTAQTFIRCGDHKSRPAQADQLHVDITLNNENVLFDGGTYQYNASPSDRNYFFGSASHNTVMLGEMDQMLKGSRFIWFYWTRLIERKMEESDTEYIFSGTIQAFRQSGKWRTLTRTVRRSKTENTWIITDQFKNKGNYPMHQIWNISDYGMQHLKFSSVDKNGIEIPGESAEGFYSPTYGIKIPSRRIIFTSNDSTITTTIRAVI